MTIVTRCCASKVHTWLRFASHPKRIFSNSAQVHLHPITFSCVVESSWSLLQQRNRIRALRTSLTSHHHTQQTRHDRSHIRHCSHGSTQSRQETVWILWLRLRLLRVCSLPSCACADLAANQHHSNCNSNWYNWGRWVLLGCLIAAAVLIALLVSCLNARRRRKHGAQPVYGTAWMAPQHGNVSLLLHT